MKLTSHGLTSHDSTNLFEHFWPNGHEIRSKTKVESFRDNKFVAIDKCEFVFLSNKNETKVYSKRNQNYYLV